MTLNKGMETIKGYLVLTCHLKLLLILMAYKYAGILIGLLIRGYLT